MWKTQSCEAELSFICSKGWSYIQFLLDPERVWLKWLCLSLFGKCRFGCWTMRLLGCRFVRSRVQHLNKPLLCLSPSPLCLNLANENSWESKYCAAPMLARQNGPHDICLLHCISAVNGKCWGWWFERIEPLVGEISAMGRDTHAELAQLELSCLTWTFLSGRFNNSECS